MSVATSTADDNGTPAQSAAKKRHAGSCSRMTSMPVVVALNQQTDRPRGEIEGGERIVVAVEHSPPDVVDGIVHP